MFVNELGWVFTSCICGTIIISSSSPRAPVNVPLYWAVVLSRIVGRRGYNPRWSGTMIRKLSRDLKPCVNFLVSGWELRTATVCCPIWVSRLRLQISYGMYDGTNKILDRSRSSVVFRATLPVRHVCIRVHNGARKAREICTHNYYHFLFPKLFPLPHLLVLLHIF